jgi:hypothetical protein
MARTPIYLDMKYWIYFRDVHTRRSTSRAHKALFASLRDRVVAGAFHVCRLHRGQHLVQERR